MRVDKASSREPVPADLLGDVLPDQTTTFTAGTIWVDITTLIIGGGDLTYDDQNLRVLSTAVTITGNHRFHNVELL